jgi:hypothetical protein
MSEIGPRITGVELTVNEIKDAIERLSRVRDNSSHSSITFHGGAGVWISATCCLLMLVMLVVGAVAYLEVRQEQRETAARMETMFMLIPDLRKMVDNEIQKRGK